MPSLFGPFRVRVDPWEVDYGSETPLELSTTNPPRTLSLMSSCRPIGGRP